MVSTRIFQLHAPHFGQYATLDYFFWSLPYTNEAVFMNALKVIYLDIWAEIIFGSRALISLSKSELFFKIFHKLSLHLSWRGAKYHWYQYVIFPLLDSWMKLLKDKRGNLIVTNNERKVLGKHQSQGTHWINLSYFLHKPVISKIYPLLIWNWFLKN